MSDKNDYNEVYYNYLICKILCKNVSKRHFIYIFIVLVVLSHKYNICCNKLNDIEGIGKTVIAPFKISMTTRYRVTPRIYSWRDIDIEIQNIYLGKNTKSRKVHKLSYSGIRKKSDRIKNTHLCIFAKNHGEDKL